MTGASTFDFEAGFTDGLQARPLDEARTHFGGTYLTGYQLGLKQAVFNQVCILFLAADLIVFFIAVFVLQANGS